MICFIRSGPYIWTIFQFKRCTKPNLVTYYVRRAKNWPKSDDNRLVLDISFFDDSVWHQDRFLSSWFISMSKFNSYSQTSHKIKNQKLSLPKEHSNYLSVNGRLKIIFGWNCQNEVDWKMVFASIGTMRHGSGPYHFQTLKWNHLVSFQIAQRSVFWYPTTWLYWPFGPSAFIKEESTVHFDSKRRPLSDLRTV